MHTRIGSLSLMSAAVNDVAAWCLVAVVVAVSRASGPVEALHTLGLAVCYVVVMLVVALDTGWGRSRSGSCWWSR